jgi:hypothetical protein
VGTISLNRGAATSIATGGLSVVAIYGGVQGGIIWNPSVSADQGLAVAELLYVDPAGPATLFENKTCVGLFPGQFYFVPPGTQTNVWVNAATSGHKFSCVVIQPSTSAPPTPIIGVFPPAGPTGLTTTLPSYLYQEYTDDDSLQSFVNAYNSLAQEYVDWFNSINLPIYTQPQIYGLLLDWVAAGIYGIIRPVLSSGRVRLIGPLNTYYCNQYNTALNTVKRIGPINVTTTSDDVFKRVITWHFYKGDGKYFSTRWLKRRTARFLFGVNGTGYEGNTYQISVLSGDDGQLNITILSGIRTLTRAIVCNFIPGVPKSGNYCNKANYALDSMGSVFSSYAVPALAIIFQEAINTGALEMPLQFSPVNVNIYPRGIV